MKRKFHNLMLEKIQNLSDRNPNEFWKLVNTIKTNKSSGTCNEISPTEWFDYFENLNRFNEHGGKNSHEVQIVKDYNIWTATKSETLGKPISSAEIYNLSKKLKNKKASSVDSLPNEIIKLAVKALPLYFVKIFKILSKGTFPSA